MRLKNLDRTTLAKIHEMVEVSFAGRDKLYSAAGHLNETERSDICRQLADHLAAHATELQQVLMATGNNAGEPLDIEAIVHTLFEAIRSRGGDSGLLDAAEKSTREVKEGLASAASQTPDPDAREMFRKQRDEVEFGEKVLRQMERPKPKSDRGESE